MVAALPEEEQIQVVRYYTADRAGARKSLNDAYPYRLYPDPVVGGVRYTEALRLASREDIRAIAQEILEER